MDCADSEELYFHFLYSQVWFTHDKNGSFRRLLRILHSTEFLWFVPNDDNRVEDGKDIRVEFFGDYIDKTRYGCSFLEMLIALSRRLAFQRGDEPSSWFWVLMGNLELHNFTDKKSYKDDEVLGVLHRVIYRTYEQNGHGGLFPLSSSFPDQRGVEIWYQMQAYCREPE